MPDLRIKGAEIVLTMDEARRELPGADVLGRPDCGRIAVGKRADIAIRDIGGIGAA